MFSSIAPEATSSLASEMTSSAGLLRNGPLIEGMVQKEQFRLQPSLMRR